MNLDLQGYVPRRLQKDVLHSLRSFPVTAILGPRQCGKSTLAKVILREQEDTVFLDLERPSDLRKLDDPEFFFRTQQKKLICIDEIQRVPELFPAIRVAVDEQRRPGKFLILGSASQDLIRQSSETLAGRIHFLELTPFGLDELIAAGRTLNNEHLHIWVRGGFPDSVTAPTEKVSFEWRVDFIRTFLEREIPQFGFSIPARTLRRFWTMLAHYHGQLLNSSKIGQSIGFSSPTIRGYLDIMEQTFMVRVLPPFHANTKKRLIKSPKVYLRDSGILHALLEIEELEDLLGHPVLGHSWEGWCMEQIIPMMPKWKACFYRTSSGEEIDLVLERGKRRLAFEFKASMSPRVSRGFPGSIEILKPEYTWIVAPIGESYPLMPEVEVANLEAVLARLDSEFKG